MSFDFSALKSWYVDHRIRIILVFSNIFLGVLAIGLSVTETLPFDEVTFSFLSFLIFLVALFRPAWIFLLLVGMIPYEIVNVAPEIIGIALRPYQWGIVLLAGALGVRFLFGKRDILFPKLTVWDGMLFLVLIGAFLSAIVSPLDRELSLKLSIILSTFFGLFVLVRIFVRGSKDVVRLTPFLFSSLIVISSWSVIQNVLFALGKESFMVMAARPNGTFTEPDWLGGYIVLLLAFVVPFCNRVWSKSGFVVASIGAWFLLVLAEVTLLLSVSRSAWIGAFFLGMIWMIFCLAKAIRSRSFISFWKLTGAFLLSVVVSFLLVWGTGLTRFHIIDRAISTGGKQVITIACHPENDNAVPESIRTIDELGVFGCQHIQLEEVGQFTQSGYIVREINRDDPNVQIRGDIYHKSFTVLLEHPIFGIGMGGIGKILGSDERGASLNASNLFLEIWLGSGLIGLVGFLVFWVSLGYLSFVSLWKNELNDLVVGEMALGFVGLTIFNMFNSGFLLAFFFLFLAIGAVFLSMRQKL